MVVAAKPEFFLAEQRSALLDLETKYVNSNSLTITQILKQLIGSKKISGLLNDASNQYNQKISKKRSDLAKLDSITRVSTTPLIANCLKSMIALEESIADYSINEAVKMKQEIWRMSEVVHSLTLCGNALLPSKDFEINSFGNNKRNVSNVLYCNKVMCCRCAPFISRKRITELQPILERIVQGNQYDLYFVTFTLRHYVGAKFKELKDALYAAFSGMIRSRLFKKVAGYIKNLEITGGESGVSVHPHIHMICAFPKNLNVDADKFATKVQNYWEKKLLKLGRSCDWSQMDRKWFLPIRTEDLKQVVNYFTCYKEPDMLKNYSILDEVLSSKQKNKNVWNLDPKIYCDVYRNSKGLRWYSTGGIFKSVNSVEAEASKPVISEEPIPNEKVQIFVVKNLVWKKLHYTDKFIVRDLINNRLLTDEQCIEAIQKILDENVQNQMDLF